MTSLRGPDPYADAEARLARLGAGRAPSVADLCRALHETIPTYDWVGLIARGPAGLRPIAQAGSPRALDAPAPACAALVGGAELLVIHDLDAAPDLRGAFPGARALIAAPAGDGRALVVASAHRGAFGLADRALLGEAARLASLIAG